MADDKEDYVASMIFPIGESNDVINIPTDVKHWHGANRLILQETGKFNDRRCFKAVKWKS